MKKPFKVLIPMFVARLLSACLASEMELEEKSKLQEVVEVSAKISSSDLMRHANILCSPQNRGRESPSNGGRRAARHIADEFRNLGLKPGGQAGAYYHFFKLKPGYRITSSLESFLSAISIGEYERGRHYMPIHTPNTRVDFDNLPCALVGYGLSTPDLGYDDYADIDVTGHAVIVFSGLPNEDWLKDKRRLSSLAYKARVPAERKAACLFIVDDPAGWRPRLAIEERLRLPDLHTKIESKIPVVHVKRDFVIELTGMSEFALQQLAKDIRSELKPSSKRLRGRTIHYHASMSGKAPMGRNVIGILPGRDKALAREAVVVGAHYDHLGEDGDGIFFGANDNASGVSALLAVGKAFSSLNTPPRRSIVFVAFDAEEVGQRGSWRYVERAPIALANSVLMVNFDMTGRNEPNEIFAGGTRSSAQLHEIHQWANKNVGLKLVHPTSLRLGLSDHSPFYERGVPILYFFGGLTVDYHTTDDRPEKLIPAKLELVSKLAFITAWSVAERKKRILFTKVQ